LQITETTAASIESGHNASSALIPADRLMAVRAERSVPMTPLAKAFEAASPIKRRGPSAVLTLQDRGLLAWFASRRDSRRNELGSTNLDQPGGQVQNHCEEAADAIDLAHAVLGRGMLT
jgi:hypothetical protein